MGRLLQSAFVLTVALVGSHYLVKGVEKGIGFVDRKIVESKTKKEEAAV